MNEQKMTVVETIHDLQQLVDRSSRNGKTVGFVPTMGYLHEGHLTLVQQARKENDIVVMSIFVNPAQFGPGEDFDAYPRNRERDSELAENAGVDILFMPSVNEMYPQKSSIEIMPGNQANALCGKSRPGHFDGVLKVVLKLFNIVDPDTSYFGKKDAQQLAIIETFVRDFNLRTAIVRVPTVREDDGLAKSSRNVNLTGQERQEAPHIYKALQVGEAMFMEGQEVKAIERAVETQIEQYTSGQMDYVHLLTYPELLPATADSKQVILACAVRFSKTRLIDNIILKAKDGANV